jgi:hypothetical protein
VLKEAEAENCKSNEKNENAHLVTPGKCRTRRR